MTKLAFITLLVDVKISFKTWLTVEITTKRVAYLAFTNIMYAFINNIIGFSQFRAGHQSLELPIVFDSHHDSLMRMKSRVFQQFICINYNDVTTYYIRIKNNCLDLQQMMGNVCVVSFHCLWPL